MNTLGMIIDTAHMSHTAMMEVVEISSKPIVNSHANLKHFCPHPRNVEDEFLFALQKN
jgi:membrane dipeptidase